MKTNLPAAVFDLVPDLVSGLVLALIAALIISLFPAPAHAENDAGAATLSASPAKTAPQDVRLIEAVKNVLAAAEDSNLSPSADALGTLADSVIADGPAERDLPDMFKADGVALRETIQSPLSRILEYAYNPDVPAYLVLPAVVRLAGWYPGSDILTLDTPLNEQLPAPQTPLVLHGREFEEITPDTFSGAYYRYDMNRLLTLFNHKGRNVLISVALQDGPSQVGKKGVVLDDGKWQYFYSNIEGLTKGGIGWMDTYLYEAVSVSVFVENPDGTTTNTIYKWLRAGWAGMNVVRGKHIIEGCRRFARAFRTVIESDLLPAADKLADKARELWALSEQELDRRIQAYASRVETLFKDHPDLSARSFAKILKNGGYAKVLDSREERISALLLEFLKDKLGTATLRQG